MAYKYLVSYSPSMNDYVLICIGGEKEKNHMQQIIDAKQSDEIILEVSQEKYDKIWDDMNMKYMLYKFYE